MGTVSGITGGCVAVGLGVALGFDEVKTEVEAALPMLKSS